MVLVAVTVEQTAWFLGAAANEVGEPAAWCRVQQWRSGMAMMVKKEEERDGSVPRRGSEVWMYDSDGVDPATPSKRAREILAA
jgi:hypothetical protein